MDEESFQRETFKLREREYRYYAEANRSQLPRIPDLADNTGGLSNPAYFNFISYCLWKVVYRHVRGPEEREAFARACAADFLSRTWQAGAPRAQTVTVPGPPAPEAAVLSVVVPFLDFLRAGGYICAYQLVLGGHPGSWPQDWMVSQPAITRAEPEEGAAGAPAAQTNIPNSAGGAPAVLPVAQASAGGDLLFQLKLHQPADILGGVALRSEEGGAWPHTVSSCIALLLQPAGYCAAQASDAPTAAVGLGADADADASAPQRCAAQRGLERDGAAAPAAAARPVLTAECDEFFYQDQWQGPTSLRDRLLLLLGDPLEQVGVDFVPTTLVQNWRLRGPAGQAGGS